jgi:hypothetical protein
MTWPIQLEPRIPDGIEPIVAIRAFRYDVRADPPGLFSLGGTGLCWSRRGWTRATCWICTLPPYRDRDHPAPKELCSCGLYALKPNSRSLSLLRPLKKAAWTDGKGFVVGRVQLAGKVIEHELGYRAEMARVVELSPVRGEATAAAVLALAYGADVSVEPLEPVALLDLSGGPGSHTPASAASGAAGKGTVPSGQAARQRDGSTRRVKDLFKRIRRRHNHASCVDPAIAARGRGTRTLVFGWTACILLRLIWNL